MSTEVRDLILRCRRCGWSNERISRTTRLPVRDVAGVR